MIADFIFQEEIVFLMVATILISIIMLLIFSMSLDFSAMGMISNGFLFVAVAGLSFIYFSTMSSKGVTFVDLGYASKEVVDRHNMLANSVIYIIPFISGSVGSALIVDPIINKAKYTAESWPVLLICSVFNLAKKSAGIFCVFVAWVVSAFGRLATTSRRYIVRAFKECAKAISKFRSCSHRNQ